MSLTAFDETPAVLDTEHVGDIRGALGTIARGDLGERRALSAKLKTLLAIVGPGLIVMVGDNDAGAFGTYAQAGQNYGTHLLWTLLLLVPVLYVNQDMVLRLGAVSGVGHARLIVERFGDDDVETALPGVGEECAVAGAEAGLTGMRRVGVDFANLPAVPGNQLPAQADLVLD